MTKSMYGDRDTLGTIALNARVCGDNPVAGDLGHELMPQLVEDLNETIASDPYDGKAFYITIHEKKDLLLRNVLLRRMITSIKRPFPEWNTAVFWTDPKTQETRFCWSLPDSRSVLNYILNESDYVKEQIEDIKAYRAQKMEHFGFAKVGKVKDGPVIYKVIPGFKDRPLGKEKHQSKFKF